MAKKKTNDNELELIEAFFSTKSEHNNNFFFKIYNESESEKIFESSLIPLQNIKSLINICYTGRAKPLQTAKEVINDIHLFKDFDQKMFVYQLLVEYLNITVWTDADGKEIRLKQIKELIDNEFKYLRNPKWKSESDLTVKRYDFETVKKHLETITDTKEKIKYLIEQKTEYLQNQKGMTFGKEWNGEKSFDQKCELEINKLNTIASLKVDTPKQINNQPISQKLIEPIRLDATQTQIVFLFQTLINEKFINENLNPKLWHLVGNYFTDKDGKTISNIHQTKDKLKNSKSGKPKAKAETIENIIKNIPK